MRNVKLRWTIRWLISVTDEDGEPTPREKRLSAEDAERQTALDHPLVAAALAAFEIPPDEATQRMTVKPLRALTPAADDVLAAVPEDDDALDDDDFLDDDPFEEDL